MPKQDRFCPKEPLVPERIREARQARGMTAIELANAVGVSRQSISKYELGIVEPSDPILEAISTTLQLPISFFNKPVENEGNCGTIFYRSLKTNAVRAKEVMSAKSNWATHISKVLEKDIIFPDVDLPSLPEELCERDKYSSEDIEEITKYIRRCWKLGSGPIANMSRLLESHGVVIATIKTGFSETDACSRFVRARPFIFLDIQKECAVRTRFNLAHELGHLVLHGGISQADINDKETLNRIESEANRFASSFLLPQDSFLMDIRSTSLASFLPLKKKWKVSIQAMVYRCRDLEIFSENQMIYIQKQISAKRWRKTEPYDLEWPCEETAILSTAIRMLIDRGDYTRQEFVSLFRLPPADIEEICGLPNGYLGEIEYERPIIIDFATKQQI